MIEVLVTALSMIGLIPLWFTVGYRTAKKRLGALPAPPRADSVVCGCGHHRAYHGGAKGVCAERVKEGTEFLGGEITKFRWKSCPCQGFVPKTPAAPQAPAVAAPRTPAELASSMGYDEAYVTFLELLGNNDFQEALRRFAEGKVK